MNREIIMSNQVCSLERGTFPFEYENGAQFIADYLLFWRSGALALQGLPGMKDSVITDKENRSYLLGTILGRPEIRRMTHYSEEMIEDYQQNTAASIGTRNWLHGILGGFQTGRLRVVSPGDRPKRILSEREIEVFYPLAEGRSNQEIGQRLGIATATVKSHLFHISTDLGLSGRQQIITATFMNGTIAPKDLPVRLEDPTWQEHAEQYLAQAPAITVMPTPLFRHPLLLPTPPNPLDNSK